MLSYLLQFIKPELSHKSDCFYHNISQQLNFLTTPKLLNSVNSEI